MATVEFVLGLQQAEEDLDWVGFFMIMVMVMVMVILMVILMVIFMVIMMVLVMVILMVILMVMVRRTWAGWVAIFSLIIFFIRKVMVMAIGASIVKNCFM